ncbi:MAG TPA: glycosyltransferase [Silvibacterium sp.]|nr:glycosyltransferase [Silvibacterium sp.]
MPIPLKSSLRVLVLDEEIPYPLDSGKRLRTWHLLTTLAARHQITFVAYGEANSSAARALTGAGIEFIPVAPRRMETGAWQYFRLLANFLSKRPFSVSKHDRRRFRGTVRRLINKRTFDLIQCEWTPYAQFVPKFSSYRNRPPFLIATHNIEADILARRGEKRSDILGRWFFTSQARRMERFERNVFSMADHVTAVSTLDRERIEAWGARESSVVANGVDTDEITPHPGDVKSLELLFLGSLDWFANIEAVRFFLREIMPLIHAREPAVRFTVVGRRPGIDLRDLLGSTEGATLVGEVDDIRPYLYRAAALVVPLRIGGGTRIKILEAMAAGKVVVSTRVGAEGLEVEDGVHVRLADTPRDFAAAAFEALHPAGSCHIAEAAREFVLERHSWRLQAMRLEESWIAVAERLRAKS